MLITQQLLLGIRMCTGLSVCLLDIIDSFSGNFLRAIYNHNVSGTQIIEDGFEDERWLLDNNLILADPTYVDNLLGLGNQVDDEITKVLSNDTSQTQSIFFNGRSHQHLRHICRQVLIQKIPEIG